MMMRWLIVNQAWTPVVVVVVVVGGGGVGGGGGPGVRAGASIERGGLGNWFC